MVADISAEIDRLWLGCKSARRIKPGMRIAVACGSRGIANYLAIAKATVDALIKLGAEPFIVAAMGSHGGATSPGQRELLAGYGIDEAHVGVPVVSDMDAVQIGVNSWNQPVWWDRNAMGADGVVAIARIKPHTDFHGRYESGIVKMLAIGLGKREGADAHHRFGTRGLRDMMPESAKVIIEKAPLLGSLAIVENAAEQTAHVEVVDRDDVLAREPLLLDKARQLMGRLPLPEIDCLIIGEFGKNYSGAGMDTNVIGRMLLELPEDNVAIEPRITRIAALDLSPESHGNATGIGLADLTTRRALEAIDHEKFRMNSLTSRTLWRSKVPLGMETDRLCIEAAVETCWQPVQEAVKFCVIPNTLELTEFWVSEPLAAHVRSNSNLQLVGPPIELPFDAGGNLIQESLFPHSLRARRAKYPD